MSVGQETVEQTYHRSVLSSSLYDNREIKTGIPSTSLQNQLIEFFCSIGDHSPSCFFITSPNRIPSYVIQRKAGPKRRLSGFMTFPPPLQSVSTTLDLRSPLAYMSEWKPANHTSFIFSVPLPGPAPPLAYSGKNFTRRSLIASAWRKAQTCLIPVVVSGKPLPLKRPIDETVSLQRTY